MRYLLTLAALLILPFNFAHADDLYTNVSWCFWHEGVRLCDDSFPGRVRNEEVLRSECVGRQGHNPGAVGQIKAASQNELQSIFDSIKDNFENKDAFQINENFAWTAHHEGAIGIYRIWASQGNYAQIRAKYSNLQHHNPNAINLLSCVSNQYIKNIIARL